MSAALVYEPLPRESVTRLMRAVVELALALERDPDGYWTADLGGGWRLTVNGTPQHRNEIRPWHCAIEAPARGMPMAIWNGASGMIFAPFSEAAVIMRLTAARAHVLERGRA